MADTTSLDDLPSANSNPEQENLMNEIVSGIQNASQNGGLDLPSRDIPINTTPNNDLQAMPDFVPTENNDYITSHENANTVIKDAEIQKKKLDNFCLLYTSPSPRDRTRSRMPSSA